MSSFQFFNRQRLVALASALFLLLCSPLAAQEVGSISGRVVTSDGEPVTDAVVTVVSTRARARADADGRFNLALVPAGVQLLEVRSVRHARVLERITVAAGDTTEVEILVVSRVHAEQIVVTASPGRLGELDLASPVNILEGRELALRLEPTIGETLSDEVGVSSTYFAPGASRPIIRGLGGDRVKMLENGLETLDASSASPDHAVAADPLVAERVEVVRGPATLLYGSSAIGGVVNVLDGRIPEFPASDSFTGTLDLRTGSVADERTAAVNLGGGGGQWAWHLDFLTRETDDYEIPGRASLDLDEHDEEEHDEDEHEEDEHGDDEHGEDEHEEDEHEEEIVAGILPNSDIEATSGGFGASYFFGDSGFLGVSVRGFDSEYGVPGGHDEHGDGHDEHGDEHDDDGEHDDDDEHDDDEHGDDEHGEEGEHDDDEHGEEGIRIDMRQRRYDLAGGITQPFGAFQGAKFRLGVVDYEHDELEAPGVVGTAFFVEAWEARAEFIQKARGSHTGSFGVQLRRRDLEAIGEEAFIAPAESDSIGLFTFQEFDRGAVSYQFGARFESQDTTVRDAELPDRDFDGLSASFGIVWRATENYSLGASLARSVKMPTGEELYSEGLHFATSAFELGDPDLTEESSLGLDVTLRKVEGRVTGAFNLFHNEFSDFIFQAFTGDEEDGFPVLQWSQADADFWGAELDLSVLLAESAHSSWDLDFLWDFVRAEFAGGGDLPRIPPQRYGIGLHYRGDRLRGGVKARFVDKQDRIAENETPTDSYTMVSADVSYRFFFENYFLDVILRGRNLTDEEARMHTSFVKDDVPLPGRNISLIARLGF